MTSLFGWHLFGAAPLSRQVQPHNSAPRSVEGRPHQGEQRRRFEVFGPERAGPPGGVVGLLRGPSRLIQELTLAEVDMTLQRLTLLILGMLVVQGVIFSLLMSR
jgi:hypothetical protein